MQNHEVEKRTLCQMLPMMHFVIPTINSLTKSRPLTKSICKQCAKARGYLARLAMAKDVLEQAVNIVMATGNGQHPPVWSAKVEASVKASASMTNHLNGQKEIMMGISKVQIILKS